jgi:hypothetical protein
MIADGGRRVLGFADELGISVERLLELLETYDLHILSETALRDEKALAVKVTADAIRTARTGR